MKHIIALSFIVFTLVSGSFAQSSVSLHANNPSGTEITTAVDFCPLQTQTFGMKFAEGAASLFGGLGQSNTTTITLSGNYVFLNEETSNKINPSPAASSATPNGDITGYAITFDNDKTTNIKLSLGGAANVDAFSLSNIQIQRVGDGAATDKLTITIPQNGADDVVKTFTLSANDPTLTVTPPTNHCEGEYPNIAFTHTAPCTNLNNPVFSLIKRSTISQAWNIGSVTDGNMGDGEYTYANFVADADAINTLYFLSGGVNYKLYEFDQPWEHDGANPLDWESDNISTYSGTTKQIRIKHNDGVSIANIQSLLGSTNTDYSNFGVIYNGYLNVVEAGEYNFNITDIDNWAELYIDDALFLYDEWTDSPSTNGSIAGNIYLATGYHKIEFRLCQQANSNQNSFGFTLKYSGPDQPSEDYIPFGKLSKTTNANDNGTGSYEYVLRVDYEEGIRIESAPFSHPDDLIAATPSISTAIFDYSLDPVECSGIARNFSFDIIDAGCPGTRTVYLVERLIAAPNTETEKLLSVSTNTCDDNHAFDMNTYTYAIRLKYDYDGGGVDYTAPDIALSITDNRSTISITDIAYGNGCPGDPVSIAFDVTDACASNRTVDILQIPKTNPANITATAIGASETSINYTTGYAFNTSDNDYAIRLNYDFDNTSGNVDHKEIIPITPDESTFYIVPIITAANVNATPICPNATSTVTVEMDATNLCNFTKLELFSYTTGDAEPGVKEIDILNATQTADFITSVETSRFDNVFLSETTYKVVATYATNVDNVNGRNYIEREIDNLGTMHSSTNYKSFDKATDFITENCLGKSITFNFVSPTCEPKEVLVQHTSLAGGEDTFSWGGGTADTYDMTLDIDDLLTTITFTARYHNGDEKVLTHAISESDFTPQDFNTAIAIWNSTSLCPGEAMNFTISVTGGCELPDLGLYYANGTFVANMSYGTGNTINYSFNPDQSYYFIAEFKNGTGEVQVTKQSQNFNLRDKYRLTTIVVDANAITPVCYGDNVRIPLTLTNYCLSPTVTMDITNTRLSSNLSDVAVTIQNDVDGYYIEYPFAVDDAVTISIDYAEANAVSSNEFSISKSHFISPELKLDGIQDIGIKCDLSTNTIKILPTNLLCSFDKIEVVTKNNSNVATVRLTENVSNLQSNNDTLYVDVTLDKDQMSFLFIRALRSVTIAGRNNVSDVISFDSDDELSIGDTTIAANADIKLITVNQIVLLENQIELTGENPELPLNGDYFKDFNLYNQATMSLNSVNFEVIRNSSSAKYLHIVDNIYYAGVDPDVRPYSRYIAIDPAQSDRGNYILEVRQYTPGSTCYTSAELNIKIQPDIIDVKDIYCLNSDTLNTISVSLDLIQTYNDYNDYSSQYPDYDTYTEFDKFTLTYGSNKDIALSRIGTIIEEVDSSVIEPVDTTKPASVNESKFYTYEITPTDYFTTTVAGNNAINQVSVTCKLWADIYFHERSPSFYSSYNYSMNVSQVTGGYRGDFELYSYIDNKKDAIAGGTSSTSPVSIQGATYKIEPTLDALNEYFHSYVDTLFADSTGIVNGKVIKGGNYKYTDYFDPNEIHNYNYIYSYDIALIINRDIRAKNFSVVKPDSTSYIINLDSSYCNNEGKLILVGNSKGNADTISGPGITETQLGWEFNPSDNEFEDIVGSDTIRIIYNYRDGKNCPNVVDTPVVIYQSPSIEIQADNKCLGDITRYSYTKEPTDNTNHESWEWDFGDNSFGENDSVVTHQYKNAGIFTVVGTVATDDGCTEDTTLLVTIESIPVVDFDIASHLESTPNILLDTKSYIGKSKTVKVDSDSIVMSNWYVDGSLKRQYDTIVDSISYIFDTYGIYNVAHSLITKNGCKDSVNKKIAIFAVEELNNENISYSVGHGSVAESWFVSNQFYTGADSIGNVTSWNWEIFPDSLNNIENDISIENEVWRAGHNNTLVNEEGWIESPCFDISDLENPMLSFNIFQGLEADLDGVFIQYTLNDGDTWELLGSKDIGIGWYNTKTMRVDFDKKIKSSEAWSQNNGEWKNAAIALDDIASEIATSDEDNACVRFRIIYSSDAFTGSNETGFAIANFRVAKRTKIVLLEQFVNNEISGSIDEEIFVDEHYNNNPEYCVIRYHMKYNYQTDNAYDLNRVDVSARAFETGSSALGITTVVDGNEPYPMPIVDLKDELNTYILQRNLLVPAFSIGDDVYFSNEDGTLIIEATVTKEQEVESSIYDNMTTFVRMAIVHPEYHNEGEVFKDVLVDLLPDGTGNVVYAFLASDSVGTSARVRASWTPDEGIDLSYGMKLIIYVQDMIGELEVHQAKQLTIPPNLSVSLAKEIHSPNATFNCYPNPADNTVYIQSTNSTEAVTWRLYTSVGMLVQQGVLNNTSLTELDIRGLAQGMYYIELYTQEKAMDKLQFIKK